MPDPFGEKGEIQWEAPSNRASGKFKHTHQRRYEWWKNKARSNWDKTLTLKKHGLVKQLTNSSTWS